MKKIKWLFYILLILAFGYGIVGQSVLPCDHPDQRNICEEYPGEWYRMESDGTKKQIRLPGKYEKGIGTLETTIPDHPDPRISCICFRGQDLCAYLDGKLIYEYSTKENRWFGQTSPETYLLIPLTADDAGKVLRLELVTDNGILYQPYWGSEFGVWGFLIKQYGNEIVIAAILFLMGVLTIIISWIYEISTKRSIDIIYLGYGVALSAVWLDMNSIFRQIMFANVSVASDIPFLMVMLIPFAVIIYMNEIQKHRFEKMYRLVGWLMGIIDITCCILYIAGIKELVSTFVFVAMGCFAAITTVVVTFFIDMKSRKIREYSAVSVGLFGAFVCSVIQLVMYFTRKGAFHGSYFAIGMLFLLVCASIHTIKSVFGIEKDKRAAEIANESKSRFLAQMSHEIRTPMNAVLGMDEMILRESREPAVREYALDIQNAGKSLLALINDILDISKIDSGKLQIIPVEYDVSSMIHDTVNMIYQKAASKGLAVEVHVDEKLPSRLRGDDIRIRQVLVNLLNNAVKYTEHGSVTLSVGGEQQEQTIVLHFEVKDTGIGIKEEDMPKLFEEFRRIEENRNRNIEGTGLGMSITVQLLRLMGSHLEVTSTYGAGSRFFFDLEQDIINDTPIGKLSERIRQQEQEYIYETSFLAPDADILVVDDNAVNRKVFCNLLKDTRMRIDEADSGEECLRKITVKKYDIIFLDHMMPGMDGIETIHAFPKQEGNRNLETSVIALTANAVTGAKEMFLQNGFDDFLAKPIVYEKLEKIFKKYLPADKLIENDIEQPREQFQKETEEEEQIRQRLDMISELNLEYAYLHYKGPKDLYIVIEDFVQMADTDASALDAFEKQITDGDYLRQYRVKVHAMKTSAAMIGAITVSGLAKLLEYAARDGKLDVIKNVHPLFLEEWRALNEHLKAVCIVQEDQQELLEPDETLIEQQLNLLTQAMEEYDGDTADEIIGILSHFRYSAEKKAIFDEIAAAVRALDADAVAEGVKTYERRSHDTERTDGTGTHL